MISVASVLDRLRSCSLRLPSARLILFAAALSGISASAQSGLQVTYGNKGIQTIAFNGTVLEDVGVYPSDSFHIWHMKSVDSNGNAVQTGQYGWGEQNDGETWNSQTKTETYSFDWGTIATQFVQRGNNLDMIVTESVNAGAQYAFAGAEIYPFLLHFPQDPKGFYGYSQYAITTTGPGVSVADFGSGVVTNIIPNEAPPLYGGWKSQGNNTYNPLMTATAPDGLATFLPHNDRLVQPGTTFTYTVSLRWTNEGTAADASDAYASFAATYPSQMTWSDHRIVGTAYLASSPAGDSSRPGGYPTNPRRYFNDPGVDITNPSGLQLFQNRMLAQAANNAANALAMNSQGVITWDLEGEQYPMNTSYVCSPDQIGSVAPEMESIITDPASPFAGSKLDDAYFKIMANAGLRTGVCLRPQVFTMQPDGTAGQVFLSGNAAIISNLETKAKYANSRWGTTIFYVDSNVDSNGGTLDPAIYQQLITDLPSFLFVPEESTPRYYAYSAPFYSFIFHTDLGTPASTYLFYPKAFGLNLVNDVSASTLAQYTPQLIGAVSKGDVLMGHADYWQANDPTLLTIYQAAGGAPVSHPKTTPSISWNTPSPISYGTPLSGAQLNASASALGTFTYSPGLGAVLGAGNQTLTATFTPADTNDYNSTTATASISVQQATPAISWAVPASIVAGTALSNLQLNATANVPGTFSYSPALGSVPAAGTNTLQVNFTPNDSSDYTVATATVPLLVTAAPVVPTPVTPDPLPIPANSHIALLYPVSGQTVSGVINALGYVNLFLDPAGTFLMVDGNEVGSHRQMEAPWSYSLDTTTLANGPHVLQLWGHDIGNNTWLSGSVLINVAN